MPVSALARVLIVLGLVLGIAGDGLLNVRPWGVNVSLWCGLAVLALLGIYLKTRVPVTSRLVAATLAWLLAAGLFAWRDSDALRALNLLVLTILTGVLLMELQPRWACGLDWSRAVAGRLGLMLWRGFDVLETWARTRIPGSPEARARKSSVLRGIAMAAPLVTVFGILLANADAAFEGLLRQTVDFHFDFALGISHFLGFVGSAWVALGLLSAPGAASFGRSPSTSPPHLEIPPKETTLVRKIGMTEVAWVLGSLGFLFGLFVMIQFRYFFGGSARVESVAGLSFAEYARSGFFELVAVTALSLPVLLGCRSVAEREGPGGHRLFLVLGGAIVMFLSVIMVSAWMRMGLYVEAYGLTALRLYVCATMVWLGGLLGWLWLSFLRHRVRLFAPGAAALGILTVFGLNVMNPDATIAKVNLMRAEKTGKLDLNYLRSLSHDAVPMIESRLATAKSEWQPELERLLAEMSGKAQRRNWRTWTISAELAARMGAEKGVARR